MQGLIRDVGRAGGKAWPRSRAAQKFFRVATVQNQYNLVDRKSEAVLAYCEKNAIGFIPWYPLAAGALVGPDSPLTKVSAKLRAGPAQVALA